MRRTVVEQEELRVHVGIISAHAENSSAVVVLMLSRGDHLRACGEQQVHLARPVQIQGSSPRMRRTVVLEPELLISARIISAHAENSSPRMGYLNTIEDHLRACGEQDLAGASEPFESGSSPRMRRTAEKARRQ